jgi:hypothetical protein
MALSCQKPYSSNCYDLAVAMQDYQVYLFQNLWVQNGLWDVTTGSFQTTR